MSIKQSPGAGGIPITRIETIASGSINLSRCGYAGLERKDCSGWLLEYGDILVSHINSLAHLGKCAIFENQECEVVHGMNLLNLRVDQRVALPRFILHALRSKRFVAQISTIAKKSVNQASFNISTFKELEIPLPPLEEQRRIAAILDKAKILEALAEKATRLHEGLLDAFFLSRVGNPATDDWPTRQAGTLQLSDVAHIRTGKLDANAATPNGQYPFFTCSKATLSIDSFCFDGEAVLVAGNGDLNVKRHSGKLNAYQRTYIISPKSGSPEEADYIYILLRLYIAKLRSLSIGGVIKYIKLPFLSDLPVGPIDSGVALEISSLQRRLSAGSSLRSTALSRIDSLASSLQAGLMEV
jgi:Type I restriction modification DNA specificity domain